MVSITGVCRSKRGTPGAPSAPARLLPWLWCPRYRCNAEAPGGRLAEEEVWRVGPEGALLLLGLSAVGFAASAPQTLGDLVRQGTLMEGVPAEDAMDLVGAGKARLAKPGDSHAPVGDDDKAGE